MVEEEIQENTVNNSNSNLEEDNIDIKLAKDSAKLTENSEVEEENIFVSIIYALILALLIRSLLFESFHIPSGSMKPGLLEGDYIFVSKFKYGYCRYSFPFGLPIIKNRVFDFKKPQRGDVVVFKLPSDNKTNYIKRLIGLPGDKILVQNNILYINGVEVPREYVGKYHDRREFWTSLVFEEKLANKNVKVLQKMEYDPMGDGYFVVPEGYYFFMGDNRDNSLDSRFKETGFVPYKNIIGEAKLIYFSKDDSFFKFWKWHKTLRFRRFFKKIV